MIKNAILLSGGSGTRLHPLTNSLNKHLLTVNDKFIIDYPIQTLKNMGVENLTVVLGGNHFSQIVDYLQDGSQFGFNIKFLYQPTANGIAAAINLCQSSVQNCDNFAVMLGDNIFEQPISWDLNNLDKAQIVISQYPYDIQRFGVASLEKKKIVKIEEKPKNLDFAYEHAAITGCYLFNRQYFDFFKQLNPSQRGEYEIVDILNAYHKVDKLHYTMQDENTFWSDAGTFKSIKNCNQYFYSL